MELAQAEQIINKIDQFVNIVNTTIGVLKAERTIDTDNKIGITIKLGQQSHQVGNFLLNHIAKNILNKSKSPIVCYMMTGWLLVQYKLEDNVIKINHKVIDELIEALYLAVDEAKVEYCLRIEPVTNKDVPMQMIWEIDTWNEDCEMEGEPERFIDYHDIYQYKIPKETLYGISLGYYAIDLDLIESDLCPELIGVIFESTEDFCYATAYEDEDYIYLYSAVEFTEDNIFDIEEGLLNFLSVISNENSEETLEDIWSNVMEEKNNE